MNKIVFLIIGTEILEGKTKEALLFWLGKELKKNHFLLQKAVIVPDDPQEINKALSWSTKNGANVLLSGGLGPTKDDITKNCLAKFFKSPLTYRKNVETWFRSILKKRKKVLPPLKHPYTFIPKNFDFLKNPTGFAPGLVLKKSKGQFLAALPGVPSEFRSMFTQEVLPLLMKNHVKHETKVENLTFKTRLLPEEHIFTKLCPNLWQDLAAWGEVRSYPGPIGVDLVVQITFLTAQEKNKKKKHILHLIKNSPLRDFIWNVGEEKVEELIVKLAKQKGLTFSIAESCTGGLVSDRITNISGSSIPFKGGVVCYNASVKQGLLKVPKTVLAEKGVVSTEVAKYLAKGVKKQIKSDIGISLTGIAGPKGGSTKTPVGTVAIGVWGPRNKSSDFYHFKGDREKLKYTFSQMALYKLLDEIGLPKLF